MGYKFLLEALKTWKMPHPQSERLEKNAMESMQTTASRRRVAAMLSELKIMNKWASVLTEYKSTGERIFEFARSTANVYGRK
jgi:hypothetical protein